MIIDGPRAPGNDIDVYLRPFVDELKELWIGVSTYDASNNHMFQMRASLLWTISDFPALGNLSGYGVKTRYACPCCLTKTKFRRLKNGQKYCFMSHRRWLPHGHKFRKDKVTFDGLAELEVAPKRVSGIEILKQMKNIRNKFGKDPLAKSRKRKWGDADDVGNVLENIWNKRSIFFELEYWKDNMMRHNLDTMHIEKNVFDNIFWTLLNVDGKGKDNLKSRLDLQEMRIRKALHPKKKANGKYYLPPTCFTLSNKQKDILLQVLRYVKVPDGYSSNISNCVDLKQHTMHGLKSHDCHVLMQQLLPIALRNLVPVNVLKPLIELSNFFRGISSTVMKIGELEKAPRSSCNNSLSFGVNISSIFF
uniref:TNP2 n=1 Tax=Solanum tuberosum TaxID=4113 RepID=M1CTG4_SOLTU